MCMIAIFFLDFFIPLTFTILTVNEFGFSFFIQTENIVQ